MNELRNAPSASGLTPEQAPDRDPEFVRLLELTEGLRSEQLIVPRIDPATTGRSPTN
jgi:hypothetical protein